MAGIIRPRPEWWCWWLYHWKKDWQKPRATFTITDTSGYTNLGVVNVLINDFIDGRSACYAAYAEGGNTLYLVDDAGDAGGPFAGSMLLDGTPGSIENSQCRIDRVGSSATGNGMTLALKLNIFFKEGFRGH